jgi:hypothetical protein
MRAKTVNEIPHYDVMYELAPSELKGLMDQCDDTPQGTDWHPEGCVGIHNRIVYDRARASGDINLALAAFFHDLGKVKTTAKNKRGGWSAHGHERVSAKIAKNNSDWIREMGGNPKEVIEVVTQHMRVKQMSQMRPPKQEAMRQNPYYNKLQQFTKFDDMMTLSKDEINKYK